MACLLMTPSELVHMKKVHRTIPPSRAPTSPTAVREARRSRRGPSAATDLPPRVPGAGAEQSVTVATTVYPGAAQLQESVTERRGCDEREGAEPGRGPPREAAASLGLLGVKTACSESTHITATHPWPRGRRTSEEEEDENPLGSSSELQGARVIREKLAELRKPPHGSRRRETTSPPRPAAG